MKKMTIERVLDVTPVVLVEQVRVQCQIKYQKEEEGIRAVGNIFVRGIYHDGVKKKPLKEVIVLDVFASNDKLLEEEMFTIQIQDSHYDVQEEHLVLTIDLEVQGVEMEDEIVDILPLEMELINEEMQLVEENKEQLYPIYEEIQEEVSDKIIIEEDKETVEEIFESVPLDLFYQQESKDRYRMIFLKENSSYEILASKYQVSMQQLMDLNGNKVLTKDMIVFLPVK